MGMFTLAQQPSGFSELFSPVTLHKVCRFLLQRPGPCACPPGATAQEQLSHAGCACPSCNAPVWYSTDLGGTWSL